VGVLVTQFPASEQVHPQLTTPRATSRRTEWFAFHAAIARVMACSPRRIKRPGESDGTCGRGEPGARRFIDQYGIDLARNAGR
jgi:hypothetical protein